METRRDEHGRVERLPDLLGFLAAGLVVGVAAMLLLDGLVAMFGSGDFGEVNGWLALTLPVWLFVEEFRAWRRANVPPLAVTVAALLGTAVGLAAGLLAAELVATTVAKVPVLTGGAGAAVAALGYALVWFHTIRWLTRAPVSDG